MTTKQPSESLLFNTARQIENPDERSRYLAAACGDDAELRQRIETLLSAVEAESQFLEQPAEGLQPTVLLADQHPSVLSRLKNTMDNVPRVMLAEPASAAADPIVKPASPELPKSDPGSRYRLDGEIARGGMGAILKGRDTDLGRDLAIKVLLDAHKDNPQVIQRFIEEAQIGGQLQHPGIAPVYELGQFADQRPFFSMKLVKGETLAKLLAGRKNHSDERGKYLGIFEQVCQTVAYAHSRNVIHRDLKPANIMVGAFGEVQVMDWGLAKVLSSGGVADERKARDSQQTVSIVQTMRSMGSDAPASFGSVGSAGSETQMGSVMGTPAYMPPEQALGEIDQLDQRSDVFGLGAILAEILTGKPPYVGDDGTQVFRMASRGKLEDCFARLDVCGADAELIRLTKACLELEPADRPKDASIVAERISQYQESVETKLRETEIQRAAEAARADAEALQAEAERQRAEAEAARAREERHRRRTSLALAASIFLLVGLSAGGWAWITNERNQRIARLTSEANQALNQATVLSEQAKAASSIDFQLFASAREQLQRANVCIDNGLTDTALIQRVQALESELAEVEKDRVFLEEIEEAWLAATESDSRAFFGTKNAKPKFLRAFRNYGLAIGESNIESAAKRVSECSDRIKEAVSSGLLCLISDDTSLTDDRIRKWIFELIEATEPNGSFNRQFLGAFPRFATGTEADAAILELADAFDETQIYPCQAFVLAGLLPNSRAIELLQNIQQQYPDNFFVNYALAAHLTYATPPQNEEVIRFYTSAIAINPRNFASYNNLAATLNAEGRHEEAVALCLRAEELGIIAPIIYHTLSRAYRELGNIPLAIASGQKVIEMTSGESRIEDPLLYSSYYNLGALYCDDLGEYDTAIECFGKAITFDPTRENPYLGISVALYKKGELRSAIEKLQEAVSRGVETSLVYTHLAYFQSQLGDFEAAVAVSHKAVELDPNEAVSHNALGNALWNTGDWDGALASYRKTLELDPQNANFHNSAAWMLAKKSDADRQFPYAEQAVAWGRRATELEPEVENYWNTYGLALLRNDQSSEAIEALHKSIELSGGSASDYLFLAMAHFQKQETTIAQNWFNKASVWKDENQVELEEDAQLQEFFVEAEQLLARATKDESDESANNDAADKKP